MHISEVEQHRLEKEHQMRHGYKMRNNQVFPHMKDESEVQSYNHKDMENIHAREINPEDNKIVGY